MIAAADQLQEVIDTMDTAERDFTSQAHLFTYVVKMKNCLAISMVRYVHIPHINFVPFMWLQY